MKQLVTLIEVAAQSLQLHMLIERVDVKEQYQSG
jgi:hypothetical protein